MSKLLGVVLLVIGIFIIAPAVGAGIALNTGMTIAVGILSIVGLICLAG